MSETNPYQLAYEREKKARIMAEDLLAVKTREVFDNLNKLQVEYESTLIHQNAQSLVVDISHCLQEQLNFSEVLQEYIDRISKLFEAKYGIIYLRNLKEDYLFASEIFYPNIDLFPQQITTLVERTQYREGKSLPGDVLKTGRELIWTSTDQKINPQRQVALANLNINACMLIPIWRHKKIIAIAEIGVKQWLPQFDEYVIAAKAASEQISIALERRNAQKKVERNYEKLKLAHIELESAQNQLIQSEKMASIGQLAAGVAHEINNPVGFVLSNVESMAEYIDVFSQLFSHYEKLEAVLDDKIRASDTYIEINNMKESEDLEFILEDSNDLLEASLKGLKRVSNIVKSLRTFAREDQGDKTDFDLNDCIEESVNMIWNEIKFKLTVHREFAELPGICGSANQMGQVIMNIVINASHAIDKQGDLWLRTTSDQTNGLVVLEIEDNGCGIAAENLAKLFDPFYTTKDVGVGTGLGLSISQGIIAAHKGKIEVDSTVGKGTKFTIKLPKSAEMP